MKLISDEKINEIRSSVDITEIISKYIPLLSKGKNYFGVCPFHDDHSPSMSVSKERQIYKCFSCGATGNAFKFLMDFENITFIEAVKKIADYGGVPLDIGITSKKKNDNVLFDIYDLSLKFYQNNINASVGKEAIEYLKSRNISNEVIKTFNIGLSLKDNSLLTKLLINKGYKESDLIKSGLINKGAKGLNDLFYNRIMFPIHNINGQVVGYSGRIYNSVDTSKYINTRETEIFKKGEILYNYHLAKDESRKKNTVILVEGFMDVIRCSIAGINNVVATMGTAVTKNQALLLKKMASDIIICFDNDEAGSRATLACADELISAGVIPKIVRLEDFDPDDYIQKYGKEKFINKIENPMSVMDFKLSYFKNQTDISNTNDMADYVNNIIKELTKINDEVLRELTIKKISKETSLEESFLRDKLKKFDNKKLPIIETKSIKLNKYIMAEKQLIYYMLRSTDVIKMYNKKITYMPTDRYRLLASDISFYHREFNTIDIADFISYINDKPDLMTALGEIEIQNLNEDINLEQIEDYINVIKEYNIKYQCARLEKQMKKETDPKEKAKILEEIIALKKMQ